MEGLVKLSNQGLPLPGRELDAAVWGLLGHEVEWRWCVGVDGVYHDLHAEVTHYYERTAEPLATPHRKLPCYRRSGSVFWVPIPKVSTTHAYHSVMEAKRTEWHFLIEQLDTTLIAWIYDARDTLGGSELAMVELDTLDCSKSLEEITAHAVCAAVWMARWGAVCGGMKEYPFTDEGHEDFRTSIGGRLGHNEHARLEKLGWVIVHLLFQIGGLLERLILRNEKVDEQSS